MAKIEEFFNKLKSNEVDVTIKTNGSAINISGDGIGGLISPKTIQKGYDSLKTMAARKGLEVTDNAMENFENENIPNDNDDEVSKKTRRKNNDDEFEFN